MWAKRAVIVAAIVVAALVSVNGASGALAPRTPCSKISGRKWQFLKGPEAGTKYSVTLIGHALTCKQAQAEVKKLINDAVKNRTSSFVNNNVLKNGPSGYACAALSSKQGYAFAGECDKGPKLNPTSGFSWAGSLV